MLTRDILSFLGGWVLIFLEVQRDDARIGVLTFAGTVLGIPGLGVAFASLATALSQRGDGTPEEPSSPQPEVRSGL